MLRRGPPRVRRDLATMQSPSIARVEKKSLRLDDEMQFIRTWMEKPISTGAVMPSSKVLARAMARYVDPNSSGPVIELGPGGKTLRRELHVPETRSTRSAGQ